MQTTTWFSRFLRIAVGVGAVVITIGCGPTRTVSELAPGAQPTALLVSNNNWHDVRIYLVPENSSHLVRIGTVGSFESRRIPLRGRAKTDMLVHGHVRFLIRPLASSTSFTTHRLLVSVGDELHLRVENRLNLSTLVPGRR